MSAIALGKSVANDLFCLQKKFLVYNLVARNLKTRYHRSVLGLFWTMVTPMSMAFVYHFIFKVVFKVENPHYLVKILSGVLPWTFFSQTIIEGMESIVGNVGLLTRVYVPLQVFSYSNALTGMVNLILAMPIVFVAAIISGTPVTEAILLLPFLILALFLVGYALSFSLAVAFVFFRDLRHLFIIFLQIWFYMTPAIYEVKMIPAQYQWILYVNPIGGIFAGIESTLIYGKMPSTPILLSIIFWTVGSVLMTAYLQRNATRGIVELI